MDTFDYCEFDLVTYCKSVNKNTSKFVMDYKKMLQNGPPSPLCSPDSAAFRNSLVWEEFFGSSLELAPSLMNIYDNKASGENGIKDSELKQQDKTARSSGELKQNEYSISRPRPERPVSVQGTDVIAKASMGKTECEKQQADYLTPKNDSKKRPLSLSSMSSSSTSSLTKFQHKRLNVADSDSSRSIPDSTDSGIHQDIVSTDDEIHMDHQNVVSVDIRDHSDIHHNKSFSDGSDKTPVPSPDFQTRHFNLTQKSSKSSKLNHQHPKASDDFIVRESVKRGRHSSRNKSSSLPTSHVIRTSQIGYHSHTERVVAELIETERNYVGHLQEIIEGYLEPIAADPKVKLDRAERVCLFSNIVEIYTFSKSFYTELEKCEGDPLAIAQCFLKHKDGFEIYTEYCTNYPSAVEILTKTMKDPELCAVFKQRQIYLGHGLPLGAYLLKPVQRVLKYHLLFQNILKNYDKSKKEGYNLLEQTLKLMTGMAYHINEMKRKHEHAVRIQEIQSQLEYYEGEDLTRLGELVLECLFRVHGAKASRQVFLFEKGLLICKRRENGMFVSKTFIQCSNLMLVESIPKEPLSFQVIPFNNSRMQYTLQARNLEQKRKWCLEIKRLMLESYQVKIPEKVKNLVMEIGMNKDEEDYLVMDHTDSGKKLHLAAPEYLEKRRMKKGGNSSTDNLLKPLAMFGRKPGGRSPSPSPVLERLPFFKDGSPAKKKNLPSNHHLDGMVTSQRNTADEQQKKEQSVNEFHTDDSGGQSQRARSFRIAVEKNPINSINIDIAIPRTRHHSVDSFSPYSSSAPSNASILSDCFSSPNQSINVGSHFDEISDDEMMYADEDDISESIYSSLPVLPEYNGKEKRPLPVSNSENESGIRELSQSFDNILPSENGSATNSMVVEHNGKENIPDNSLNSSLKAQTHKNHNSKKRTSLHSCDSQSDFNSSMTGSQAKLTDWNNVEKFTKGSFTDVSELNIDPWIQQSSVNSKSQADNVNNTSLNDSYVYSQQLSKASRQYQDWLVYANRNSLPVNFNPEDISKMLTSSKSMASLPVDNTPSFKRKSLINKPKSCPRDKIPKKCLHRSHSTPNASMSMYSNWKRAHHYSLTDNPEELVAEMEHYIKNTSSSSNVSKFPIIAQSSDKTSDMTSCVWVKSPSTHSSSSTESLPSDCSDAMNTSNESLRRRSSNSSLVESIKSSRPTSLYLYDNIGDDLTNVSQDNDDDLVKLAGNYGPKMRLTLADDTQTTKVYKKPDLPSILLEAGPGSHLIGSRIAESVYGPLTEAKRKLLTDRLSSSCGPSMENYSSSNLQTTDMITSGISEKVPSITISPTSKSAQRESSISSDQVSEHSGNYTSMDQVSYSVLPISNERQKYQHTTTILPVFSTNNESLSTKQVDDSKTETVPSVSYGNFTNCSYSQNEPIMIPCVKNPSSKTDELVVKTEKYSKSQDLKYHEHSSPVKSPPHSSSHEPHIPSLPPAQHTAQISEQNMSLNNNNAGYTGETKSEINVSSEVNEEASLDTRMSTQTDLPVSESKQTQIITSSQDCHSHVSQPTIYSLSPSSVCNKNIPISSTYQHTHVTYPTSYSKIVISNSNKTNHANFDSSLKSIQCLETPLMSSTSAEYSPSTSTETPTSQSMYYSRSKPGEGTSRRMRNKCDGNIEGHQILNVPKTETLTHNKSLPSKTFVSVSPVFPIGSLKMNSEDTGLALPIQHTDATSSRQKSLDNYTNYSDISTSHPNVSQPHIQKCVSSPSCSPAGLWSYSTTSVKDVVSDPQTPRLTKHSSSSNESVLDTRKKQLSNNVIFDDKNMLESRNSATSDRLMQSVEKSPVCSNVPLTHSVSVNSMVTADCRTSTPNKSSLRSTQSESGILYIATQTSLSTISSGSTSNDRHSNIASLRKAFFNSPITSASQPPNITSPSNSPSKPLSPKEHFLSLSPDNTNHHSHENFTQVTKYISSSVGRNGLVTSKHSDITSTGSSSVFSPSEENNNEPIENSNLRRSFSESSIASMDSIFERRFSKVFDDDKPFICDIDIDNEHDSEQPANNMKGVKSIKRFVQYIEEKNKPRVVKKHSEKRHLPGPVIQQKMMSLQKSQSCDSSRASSEDRELQSPILNNKHTDVQNTVKHDTGHISHAKSYPRSRHSASPTLLRSATSMVQLDQLGHPRQEMGNVVIISGWVKKVISKFQNS